MGNSKGAGRGPRGWWRGCLFALGLVILFIAMSAFLLGGALFLALRSARLSDGDVCETSHVALLGDARRGDIDALKAELDRGFDPNTSDDQENTALGCAIPRGQVAATRLLLDRGADPNKPSGKDTYRELPLGLAFRQSDDAIAIALLDHQADPNATLPGRGFPLTNALEAHRAGLVQALFAHGADANGGADPPRDPGCGADPPDTRSAFTIHLSAGTDRCALPPRVPLQSVDNVEQTTDLLDRGADPNGRDGRRPLYDAVNRGGTDSFDTLIARGANPSLPVFWGTNRSVADAALLSAAGHGHAELVDRLLAVGANPNATNYRSALSRAVGHGDHAIVARLLDAGADPNASGASAAEVCTMPTLPASLDPFFDHALPGLPTQAGTSTGTSATQPPPLGTHLEACDRGTPVGTTPGALEVSQYASNATDFLDPSSDFQYEMPALVIATLHGNNEDLQQLLQHGADPNKLGLGRLSPLAVAAATCNADAVQILLANGATTTASPPDAKAADLACPTVRPLVS